MIRDACVTARNSDAWYHDVFVIVDDDWPNMGILQLVAHLAGNVVNALSLFRALASVPCLNPSHFEIQVKGCQYHQQGAVLPGIHIHADHAVIEQPLHNCQHVPPSSMLAVLWYHLSPVSLNMDIHIMLMSEVSVEQGVGAPEPIGPRAHTYI
jgi:hypothetical protein